MGFGKASYTKQTPRIRWKFYAAFKMALYMAFHLVLMHGILYGVGTKTCTMFFIAFTNVREHIRHGVGGGIIPGILSATS
jgi:hypothetical protein